MPWASERVELFNPSVPRQPARRAVMGSMRDTRWQTLLAELFASPTMTQGYGTAVMVCDCDRTRQKQDTKEGLDRGD